MFAASDAPSELVQLRQPKAIRALDDRYKLFAFLSTSLPDYILVSPAGVQVLIVRRDAGQVACVRDQWKTTGSRLMSSSRSTGGGRA